MKHIDPKLAKYDKKGGARSKWIAILGAIADAEIGRDDGTYMDFADKWDLADEWSSGALGGFSPTNYKDCDDVFATMEDMARRAEGEDQNAAIAGIGTIIDAAWDGGMDEAEHQSLRRRNFSRSPSSSNTSGIGREAINRPKIKTKSGDRRCSAWRTSPATPRRVNGRLVIKTTAGSLRTK